jgi:asparagine synthase (glutamine-hydrolysing)
MCGVNGIFAYSDSAPRLRLRELLEVRDAMASRGPDGAGEWLSNDERVGLGHRRLSFVDLSDAGAQPMATADESLRITFNGEIYNYQSIRARLVDKGVVFRSHSDTEVLLHLYAEKGPAMLSELRGMYAFAIWDNLRRRIFLARDPFGIKPLYFSDDGKTLRFASQVKALLHSADIDTGPEPAAKVGFMLWGYVPEPYTLYSGIRALPAGSWMSIDAGGAHASQTFCRISDEIAAAEDRAESLSAEEVAERLRAAMLDSVSRHLIADVPVGAFLSSGLDSTTITALASEVTESRLHTVTLGFEEFRGTEADEVPLAELVARSYRTTHQTRWVTRNEFQEDFARLLSAMDQPSIDGVNTYFVSKATKQSGLKAALSGLGGDELFGGYPSFQQIPHLVRAVGKFPIGGAAKALRAISAPVLKHFTSSKYAGLLEYGGTYGGAYLLRRALFMPWELPDLLDPDLAREGWRELEPMLRLEATAKGIDSERLRVSALEMTWYMRNQLLRDSDWAGMAHSIEIRVPLVDLHLLRAVVPLRLQSRGKSAMARTPAARLPEAILNRRKTGFSVPVRDWLDAETPQRGARGLRGWAMRLAKEFEIVSGRKIEAA